MVVYNSVKTSANWDQVLLLVRKQVWVKTFKLINRSNVVFVYSYVLNFTIYCAQKWETYDELKATASEVVALLTYENCPKVERRFTSMYFMLFMDNYYVSLYLFI